MNFHLWSCHQSELIKFRNRLHINFAGIGFYVIFSNETSKIYPSGHFDPKDIIFFTEYPSVAVRVLAVV